METLAKRLTRLRQKNELTISDVAKAIGVSASTYRDWEYGREIKGEPYVQLAQALGVSLSYLISGVEYSHLATQLASLEEQLKRLTLDVQRIRALF